MIYFKGRVPARVGKRKRERRNKVGRVRIGRMNGGRERRRETEREIF